jgi:outer membrane biosynthesis protein TonB
MGKRGPVPQPRKKITCHLGPLATRLLEEKIPKLRRDKRGRPLIGAYLSGLIERDLKKRESELVAKFKDAPSTPKPEPASKIEASPKPKMKPKPKPEQKLEQKDKAAPPKPETKPEKTWLEKDKERVRKARLAALERGELHDEDDDESFY